MQCLTLEQSLEYSPSSATEPEGFLTSSGKTRINLSKQRKRFEVVLYQLLQAEELPQPLGQLAQLVVLHQEAPQTGQLQQLLGEAPQLVVAGVETRNTKGKDKHSGVFRNETAHRIFVSHRLLVRTLLPVRKTWLLETIIFIYLLKKTFNPALNLEHSRWTSGFFVYVLHTRSGSITSPCAEIYKITPVNRRF